MLYTEEAYIPEIGVISSMMNDYRKRMSSSELKAYTQAGIMVYDSLESQIDTSQPTITVHSESLPGFLSIQRSVDRYIINEKQEVELSAAEVRDRVKRSYSLKSPVETGERGDA